MLPRCPGDLPKSLQIHHLLCLPKNNPMTSSLSLHLSAITVTKRILLPRTHLVPSPTGARDPDADDKWRAADFIASAALLLCLTDAPPSSLSADLSQLQLQTPRDAQRQGGAGRFPGWRAAASQSSSRRRRRRGRRGRSGRSRQPCHPAITGPSRSLPGGEEPTSPAGVRKDPCRRGCPTKCL